LIAVIKDWLPITKRNRVALGFAFAALVMFVTWNFLPDPHGSEDIVAMELWPELVSLDNYINAYKSPDIDEFRSTVASMSVILNGLLILAIVPFWRILHASNYIRVPLAVLNLIGGLMVLWYVVESLIESDDLDELFVLLLIALSMLALSVALFIFNNELGIRHELEVKKTMVGGE
jgi:hypothetical protein